MRVTDLLLAGGMLFAGTINTIASKYQDIFSAVGKHGRESHKFNHPGVQTLCMFTGEILCLAAFFVLRRSERREHKYAPIPDGSAPSRTFPVWLFALPAMCDMTGSTLMYIGLSLTYPSVYQMIRGMIVVFTGLFSWWFLKTKLYGYHILGMCLIVTGTALVGVSSVLHKSGDASNPLLGDVFVVFAQLAGATQMVVEEKFIGKYDVPPLQVVGNEGAWGVAATSLILFILYWIKPLRNVDHYDLDTVDAFLQIGHNHWLLLAILASIFSIAFFNFFGISVTKSLSATHRTTVDASRVFLVWIFSLIIGWEHFQWLQLIGFVILLAGTATFNEIFRLPYLYYPNKAPHHSVNADDAFQKGQM